MLAAIKSKINKGTFASPILIEKNTTFENASENGAKYLSICSSMLAALAVCASAHNKAKQAKSAVGINPSSSLLFFNMRNLKDELIQRNY